MAIQAYAMTHPGTSRQTNEDSWLIDQELGLCVISDGITHPKGAECSDRVCKGIQRFLQENRRVIELHNLSGSSGDRQALAELVRQAVESVSATLYIEAQSRSEMKGVFATACLVLMSRGYAFIAHLGDSRAYSVREGAFHLLTRDHTYLAAMLADGKSLEDAQRTHFAENLSSAMGFQPVARASVQVRELASGERIVLCTDGLSDLLGHASFRAPEWSSAVSSHLPNAFRDFALKKTVRDNVTAIVVEWESRKTDTTRVTKDVLSKLSTVRGIQLFQHFGEKSLMKLLSLADTCDLSVGESLMRKGEISNEMHIVLSGELSVDLGKGSIASTVKKGEVVGEMSLFEGSLPSATLTALMPTTVLTFHRDHLFQAMKDDTEFAARFELGVLQAVIRRLRERTEPDEELKKLKNYTVVSILPPEQA